MPKKRKQFIALSLSILLLGACIFGLFKIFIKNPITTTYAVNMPNFQTMVDNRTSLNDLSAAHHKYMNDLFNSKVKKIKDLSVITTETTADITSCSEDNISTYCLATQGSEELKAYILALKDFDSQGLAIDTQSNNSIQNYVYTQGETSEVNISQEIDAAIESFDLALTLYDGYLKNYQMHKEYKKIIEDLEKYRDQ